MFATKIGPCFKDLIKGFSINNIITVKLTETKKKLEFLQSCMSSRITHLYGKLFWKWIYQSIRDNRQMEMMKLMHMAQLILPKIVSILSHPANFYEAL